jgi:RNA polymerase sigma-70 factor, ECF subfamily
MATATSLPDDELLRQIARGDRAALEVFYDRYERPVYGLLVGILKNTDDAEDIMQDVFAQVWKKADTFAPEYGNGRNWVLRIAHNKAINFIRSRAGRNAKNKVELSTVENEISHEALPSDQVGLEDERIHLNRALNILPEDQRSLIILAFLQGLSHSEIAEKTSIPLGTVKTRIRSGIISLRKQLAFLSPQSQFSSTSGQSTRSNNV